MADEHTQSKPISHFLREPGVWWLFFPELPIAAVLTIVAPVWAISLLLEGKFGPAAMLMLGVGVSAYGVYVGVRANEKWAVYICVLAILGMGLWVSSIT